MKVIIAALKATSEKKGVTANTARQG